MSLYGDPMQTADTLNILEERATGRFRQARPSWRIGNFSILLSLLLSVVASVFLIVIIVLSILYGIERNKTIVTGNDNDLCLTPNCIKAANYLLDSIDETVDPCENFYDFACGTWMKNVKIADDDNFEGVMNTIQVQLDDAVVDVFSSLSPNGTIEPESVLNARRLYASCINEEVIEAEGIDAILSLINTELGGWPMLQGSMWDNTTFNLSRVLLKLNQLDIFVFYGIETDVDEQNSSIERIKIGPTRLGLKDTSHYIHETEVTRAYRQFLKDFVLTLTNDTSMIDKDVNAIFALEQTIVYFWMIVKQNGRNLRTTLDNLSTIVITSFDIVDHLRRLYLSANVTLIDTDIVLVSAPTILQTILSFVDRTSSRTVQNYMIWRFMMNQVSNMPKRFRAIADKFNQVLRGTLVEHSRSITCGRFVNSFMPFVVSKLYINKYFDKNVRIQSREMIGNIRNMFIQMINQSTWMDAVSKSRAIEKARAINEKVGYPDYLGNHNSTKLENDYVEYIFNSSFIRNTLIVLELNAKKSRQMLRQPRDREAWIDFAPTTVNAFYRPSWNDISFPASFLQIPLFYKDVPKYLNYGAVGTMMGHEITHGFDDSGRQFDKDGNEIPWWTTDTIDAFNQQTLCLIEQYNNYTITPLNLRIDGQRTLGENIADNGGLKASFLAYQKWAETHPTVDKKLPGLAKYSAEQMFFLNFGHSWCAKMRDQYVRRMVLTDEHPPHQFRVLGPTSNFVEFDRVFRCEPGQDNSRVNKCTVW